MTLFLFTKCIFKYFPKGILQVLSLLVIGSLIEGMGLMLLVPILQLVTSDGAETSSFLLCLRGFLGFIGVSFDLMSGLITFYVVFLIQILFCYMKEVQVAKNIVYFKLWLRERLYRAIFHAEWPFFFKHKRGFLINSILIDCDKSGIAFHQYLLLCSGFFIVLIYSSVALLISWKFTLLVFVAAITTTLLLKRIITRGSHLGKTTAEANGQFQSVLGEHFDSAKLIKGSGVEETATSLMVESAQMLADLEKSALENVAKLRCYAEPINLGVLCLSIYAAIEYFKLDFASLIVLILIFFRLFPRIMQIQQDHFRTMVYIPSFQVVESLTQKTESLKEAGLGRGVKFSVLKKGIEFDNVWYAYHEGKSVLKKVSFRLEKGKTIGLAGGSGAGKSTISDMVLGLLHPAEGTILLDDKPLKEYDLLTWRKHIGYVTQETILLHDTIRANITWGLDKEISDEDIYKAARLAHAHGFIKGLLHGYDTVVGDRGVCLSGGQRQRLALARALARDPQLLILDEATSSLDAESEAQVQKAIDDLSRRMSILVIAHRLSTIKNVDKIYVLEEGKIVESGTWSELYSNGGRFSELYKLQITGHSTV